MKLTYSYRQLLILSVTLLAFTGCDSEEYLVSQTPVLNQFEQKSPEQIYQQGKEAKVKRRYNTAIRNFRACIVLFPKSEEAPSAYLDLIDCYTARGQFEEALITIERFLSLYPETSHQLALEKKRARLLKKQTMDRFYHFKWLGDIRQKNKYSYQNLERVLDLSKKFD